MTSAADLATRARLTALGAELSRAFADERSAIATLDHERITALHEAKTALVRELAELLPIAQRDPELRRVFALLRTEAHATAMLAAAAGAGVRALLGYETTSRYDRRARQITEGPSRVLTGA
jgi:hypothetical protein